MTNIPHIGNIVSAWTWITSATYRPILTHISASGNIAHVTPPVLLCLADENRVLISTFTLPTTLPSDYKNWVSLEAINEIQCRRQVFAITIDFLRFFFSWTSLSSAVKQLFREYFLDVEKAQNGGFSRNFQTPQ